jgi:hypothetical protein
MSVNCAIKDMAGLGRSLGQRVGMGDEYNDRGDVSGIDNT